MSKQAVLIVSGYNFRAVVSFCRWATEFRVPFFIVAKDRDDPIFLTDYSDKVFAVRNGGGLGVDLVTGWVRSLYDDHGCAKVVILPSSEYLNRFLLRYREYIESDRCIVPLVDRNLYERISDKHSFCGICQEYGLDVPKEYGTIPDELPFVAKPRSYLSSSGKQLLPYIITSHEEYDRFQCGEDGRDYFFQQYVEGRSVYLLAYIAKRDGVSETVVFSQENLLQQVGGGSIILAKRSDFHLTDSAARYVSMLEDIGFYGLIMVEVRLDDVSDSCCMIEANPRLWGPMQFCVDNNIDLFGGLLRGCGFDIPRVPPRSESIEYYFWSDGMGGSGSSVVFHRFTEKDFFQDYCKIRVSDLFCREDTLRYCLEQRRRDRYE